MSEKRRDHRQWKREADKVNKKLGPIVGYFRFLIFETGMAYEEAYLICQSKWNQAIEELKRTRFRFFQLDENHFRDTYKPVEREYSR